MEFWRKFPAFSSHCLACAVDSFPEVTSEVALGGFLMEDMLSLEIILIKVYIRKDLR